MKKRLVALLFLLVSLGFVACAQQNKGAGEASNTTQKEAVVKNVDVNTFAELKSKLKDAIILDVRTPEEFAQGHLTNAVNINIYGNFEEEVKKLDKDKPVLVYCRSGHRSGIAAKKMQKLGFKKVYNLSGGIIAWASAGKEVEK